MIRDEQGRPWERLVHCGSELDVVLGMPSLLNKMRRIVEILDKEGDRRQAEKLGEQIWNDTQIVFYSLYYRWLDETLDRETRTQALNLSDLIEEFQQEILIKILGIVDVPNDPGTKFLTKLIEPKLIPSGLYRQRDIP